MQVSTAEVSSMFDALLAGTVSREAAETWAEERMRLSDEHQLEYTPRAAEAQIRDGIHYLAGVALRTSPDEYLHADDDFRAYRRSAGL
jgi:hypothetical protein